MRLLDTATGEFRWIDSPLDKPYAILSHTWDGAEQSHHNIVNIRITLEARGALPNGDSTGLEADAPRVSILSSSDVAEKVRRACAIAQADGYELIWIDSCCIDKTSSAELSEAINSMYSWYRHAEVCYVYLSDVDDDDLPSAPGSQFRRARWHSRGWTLQELLAPRYVVFYSRGWRVLGTKNTLADVVEEVTGIDRAILNHELPLQSVSVARRMWWASARVTARVEDEAYCLMGIFGINMPTIYGEGRHAFVRLQEEILKVVPDQTIFSWALRTDTSGGAPDAEPHRVQRVGQAKFFRMLNTEFQYPSHVELQVLLASSPSAFATCADVRVVPHRQFLHRLAIKTPNVPPPQYTVTPSGIRTCLPFISIQHFPKPFAHALDSPSSSTSSPDSGPTNSSSKVRAIVDDLRLTHSGLALLQCEDKQGRVLALPLYRGINADSAVGIRGYAWRALALAPADLAACLPYITLEETLILRRPKPQSLVVKLVDATHFSHEPGLAGVTVPGWCQAVLRQQGFGVGTIVRESTLIKEHSATAAFPGFLYGYAGEKRQGTWEDAAQRHKDHIVSLTSDTTRERITVCIGTHYRTDSVMLWVRYRTPGAASDGDGDDGKVSYAEGAAQPQSLQEGMRFPASGRTMWAVFRLEDGAGSGRTLRLSFARSQDNHRELELNVELSDMISTVVQQS